MAIFFLSGLSLRTQEISQAMRSFPAALARLVPPSPLASRQPPRGDSPASARPVLSAQARTSSPPHSARPPRDLPQYGIISTLALAPLAAIPVLALSAAELPRALAVGLAVMCCVPTTLSTGVVLTGSVGGNVAVALALVLLTNIAGVFTIPYAVKYVLGDSAAKAAAAIKPELMVTPLAESILVRGARVTRAGERARAGGKGWRLRMRAVLPRQPQHASPVLLCHHR